MTPHISPYLPISPHHVAHHLVTHDSPLGQHYSVTAPGGRDRSSCGQTTVLCRLYLGIPRLYLGIYLGYISVAKHRRRERLDRVDLGAQIPGERWGEMGRYGQVRRCLRHAEEPGAMTAACAWGHGLRLELNPAESSGFQRKVAGPAGRAEYTHAGRGGEIRVYLPHLGLEMRGDGGRDGEIREVWGDVGRCGGWLPHLRSEVLIRRRRSGTREPAHKVDRLEAGHAVKGEVAKVDLFTGGGREETLSGSTKRSPEAPPRTRLGAAPCTAPSAPPSRPKRRGERRLGRSPLVPLLQRLVRARPAPCPSAPRRR